MIDYLPIHNLGPILLRVVGIIIILLFAEIVGLGQFFGYLIAKNRSVKPVKVAVDIASQTYKGIESLKLRALLIAKYVAVFALDQNHLSIKCRFHEFVFPNRSGVHVLLTNLPHSLSVCPRGQNASFLY